MTNLLTVIPDFDIQAFSHIIPSLEKALVSTADLLTLDALDVAKRAHVPTEEVKRLTNVLLEQLNGENQPQPLPHNGIVDQHIISLLDDGLDAALNGGVHTGFLTEVSGESAAGKTQVLLTLLLSVQLRETLLEPQFSALYISTEAQLPTHRLKQILHTHPRLQALDEDERPTLDRVHSTRILDLDSQEHILRFQVPILIARHNIGLLIIDSIAANYRAELDKGKHKTANESRRNADFHARRSLQISKMSAHLRDMAQKYNIAIVVANQVADRFDSFAGSLENSQSTQRSLPNSPPREARLAPVLISPDMPDEVTAITPSTDDPLSLDHQQRFFTGWGDDAALATRIVLHVEPYALEDDTSRNSVGRPRTLKVVFSAWCATGFARFDIWQGGLRSITRTTDQAGVT